MLEEKNRELLPPARMKMAELLFLKLSTQRSMVKLVYTIDEDITEIPHYFKNLHQNKWAQTEKYALYQSVKYCK